LLYSPLFVPLTLIAMTLAMFADVLFMPGDPVLSQLGMDTSNIFVYWRQFGFEQLRAGHLALLNPHVYSGLPFLGGFEEALLYPPNWILYLTLPLAKAINFEFALHVFLLGLFMAMWVGRYNLHPIAALFAACVAMFSRPFFGAILAGALPHMDTMAWAPLILLTVDSLLDQPCFKWILIGMFALSMQILAGFPQVLFDTILTCAIYAAIRLARTPRPTRSVLALLVVGVGAALICAGQLWVGLQAAAEGTRQGGTSFAFASSWPLSYDAFLSLLVPDLFGDIVRHPVWIGTGASLFFGLTGLTMAIVGTTVKSPHRGVWIAMVVVLLCIALGTRTPLFGVLYRLVPGFNLFRRPAAFVFEFVLFAAMLSAFGMDALIRSAARAKAAGAVLLIVGFGLAVVGAVLRGGGSDALRQDLVQVFVRFSDFGILPQYAPGFEAKTELFAGAQSLISACICLVLSALLFARPTHRQAAYVLAVFGVGEAFGFARSNVTTFHLAATVPTQVQQFVAAHPGDYRILNPVTDGIFDLPVANGAVLAGAKDISGYDPLVPKRYAEFMFYSHGLNPDEGWMILDFRQVSPMWRLLRLRYVFFRDRVTPIVYENPGNRVVELPSQLTSSYKLEHLIDHGDLPHVLLVDEWRRIEHRGDILAALVAPSFDAGKTVILESDPVPAPVPGPEAGAARILSSTTDSLIIAADVKRPMLLMVTDSYSRYWRAVALNGSSQSQYHVMPADYAVMAVALGAGHHLFRLEYAPSGWLIGRWISLASLLLYVAAIIWWRLAARDRR
jgi:hypothetical protein